MCSSCNGPASTSLRRPCRNVAKVVTDISVSGCSLPAKCESHSMPVPCITDGMQTTEKKRQVATTIIEGYAWAPWMNCEVRGNKCRHESPRITVTSRPCRDDTCWTVGVNSTSLGTSRLTCCSLLPLVFGRAAICLEQSFNDVGATCCIGIVLAVLTVRIREILWQ